MPAGKDRIEQLLALGATRWEAAQAALQRCVRVALTPILNQMNVVGIVSIPGASRDLPLKALCRPALACLCVCLRQCSMGGTALAKLWHACAGMMTGQILSGSDPSQVCTAWLRPHPGQLPGHCAGVPNCSLRLPSILSHVVGAVYTNALYMNCSDAAQAARYQMIIMFIISATTSVGSVCTLYMASSYCIDAKCRLRLDRVSKRDKANAWNRRLFRHSIQVPI